MPEICVSRVCLWRATAELSAQLLTPQSAAWPWPRRTRPFYCNDRPDHTGTALHKKRLTVLSEAIITLAPSC